MNETTGNNTDTGVTGRGHLSVAVTNIGGIAAGRIAFEPGVTILSGANASNKSSLLQGLMAVLGGPDPSLKGDVDHGEIRLDIDGGEYALEVSRRDGGVVTDGTPFSDERDRCRLFASLDEMNPVRRAVVGDGDLHDLLMRPVDTDEIEAEIARLEARKESVAERIDEVERLEDRLPSVEAREQRLEDDLDAIEADLADVRQRIQDAETDQTASTEAQALLDDLEATRTERETLRDRIRTQESALDSLREEREEVRERLDSLDDGGVDGALADVEHEIDQLRQQKTVLSNTISSLSPIVEMNRQLLEDEGPLSDTVSNDDVVAELDPASRTIACWTCGSTVERAQIAEQVEVVQEILQEKREQRRAIEDEIQSLTEKKRTVRAAETEREELADRVREIEREIASRERTLADLRADRDALDDEVADLEAAVAETEDLRDSDVVDLHQEASELEYERGQVESRLAAVREERVEIAEAVAERESLVAERESVRDRLTEERDRIQAIERETVATINECMQAVLDRLDYENLERVWVERVARGGGPADADFELHVVRTTEDGAAYEDVIEHLSKSEREVVGLVVALAGYIVHDVADEVPVVVIDAIEMLDADRIRALLDFFSQHARYVVAATLPEEATELADTYTCVEVDAAVAA